MPESANNKADVRAWLYELLAELERCQDCEGTRTKFTGNKITLTIQIQS